ncbi:hypothetical protein G6038_19970 [Rhodococcus sp. 14C212]|uniref:hypothetical protein n=1 Tax=Rhodococcus sp. 14C212 TaxID=2711209 RepID=UPI0013EA6366|nr:hypothetical protein [Rhodococcus sp. 14C212]NGP07717.1 hypothetical protein [Rhodococcus sp. 14C212]
MTILSARLSSPVVIAAAIVGIAGFLGVISQGNWVSLIAAIAIAVTVVAIVHPAAAIVISLGIALSGGSLRRIFDYYFPDSSGTGALVIIPAAGFITAVISAGVKLPAWRASAMNPAWITVTAAVMIAGVNPFGAGIGTNLAASALALGGMMPYLLAESGILRLRHICGVLGAFSLLNSAYVLWHEFRGPTAWDYEWAVTDGYAALWIGPGILRPVGIASSTAESSILAVLGFALFFGLGARRLRPSSVLFWCCAGLCLAAVLVSGMRMSLILAVLSATLFIGMRLSLGLFGFLGISITGVGATIIVSTMLVGKTNSAGLERIVGLLSGQHALEDSTVPLHIEMIGAGVTSGLGSIIGWGSGLVSVLTGNARNTEFDFSNLVFMAGVLGLVGGLTMLFSYIKCVRYASQYVGDKYELILALSIAAAAFGQWMNIGFYGILPLVWILLGCVSHQCRLLGRAQANSGSAHNNLK